MTRRGAKGEDYAEEEEVRRIWAEVLEEDEEEHRSQRRANDTSRAQTTWET